MKNVLLSLILVFISLGLIAQTIVNSDGINETNVDVSDETVLSELTISPTEPGKVIVRFDGQAYSTPGDRILLAASDEPDWGVNDGHVGVSAINSDITHNTFSHSRVYDVSEGDHTFYAVAQVSSLDNDGDGIASFYGNLSVQFVPESEGIVMGDGINETNVDVSDETVLSELTINPTEPGKVIVRFDGQAYSTPGDRILLAASDEPDWGVNDGHVGVSAINSDITHNTFSHSRVYDVSEGDHTFYAVAQVSSLDNDGDGIASFYGNLSVQFVPESEGIVMGDGINETNVDVSDETVLSELTINPTEPGKVIVRFDGQAYSTPGDRILLAANDEPDWGVNDGHVGVSAINSDITHNTFSHSRVYDVSEGDHTFYAVAQVSSLDNDGDGIASVYGNLTVEFIPSSVTTSVAEESERKSDFNAYPNPVSHTLILEGELLNNNAVVYQLQNLEGNTLKSGELQGDGEAMIDVSNVDAGVYLLRVKSEQQLTTKKIVIE